MVNFGPLTTMLCLLVSFYSESTVHTFLDNFRLWLHNFRNG